MSVFTVINDETLVAAIDACESRLAYIAPGISEPVAMAIERCLERSEAPTLTIIIDTDPEICRLGYGTVDGLKHLHKACDTHQVGIRHQEGLRIAALAVDDKLFVYAPTPLLIETSSLTVNKPNALLLGSEALQDILVAAGVDGSEFSPLPSESEIGQQAATPAMLKETLEDLKRQPPRSFDVAQLERVFSSHLQYAELEITGYRMSSKKANIPNDLLIGDDRELQQRLQNSFKIFEKKLLSVEINSLDAAGETQYDENEKPLKKSFSEQDIENERKALYQDFLSQVPRYGWFILRKDRIAFQQRVDVLEKRIKLYQIAVEQHIDEMLNSTVKSLSKQLYDNMGRRLISRLSKKIMSHNASDEENCKVLENELHGIIGSSAQVFNPQVKLQFKDLTYETIKEPKFLDAISKVYRSMFDESGMTKLFNEYDAVRASQI